MITASIRAVVLDMDGLLIDTEPVWRTAEQEVFADLGIELTQADVLDTTGVRIDELVAAFLPRRPPPANPPGPSPACSSPPGPSPAEVAARITDLVADYVRRAGEPMPGVPEAIALFGRPGLRLAIASSSPDTADRRGMRPPEARHRRPLLRARRAPRQAGPRCVPGRRAPPATSARPAAWPSKTPRPGCWPRKQRA